MKRNALCLSTVLGLLTPLLTAFAAQAQNYTWEEQQVRNRQRQAEYLQQQSMQPKSTSVLQSERWESEWKQQHPGEPVPNAGVLQKLHRGEILNTMNNGWAQSRQIRQAKLQHDYQLVRQNQAQKLAAQGITWSPQQWANWDRQYDQQQRQNAQDYLNAVKETGEIQEQARRNHELYGTPTGTF